MKRSPKVTVALVALAMLVGAERLGRRGDLSLGRVIGELRAVRSAQETFASSCGAGGYAASLQDLRVPPLGASNGFIGPGVGTTTRDYVITVERNGRKLDRPSCNGVPLVSAYFAHAEPTGGQPLPSFAMNDAGAIVMRRDGQRMSPALEGAERVDDGYVTEWR